MRLFTLVFSFFIILSPSAQASPERLRVSDIHGFVANLNLALNGGSEWIRDKDFLSNAISDNAVFSVYLQESTEAKGPLALAKESRNKEFDPSFRFPAYNTYLENSNFKAMNKWDLLTEMETKRRVIPGYQNRFELISLNMPRHSPVAVLELNFYENSLTYEPAAHSYRNSILNAQSYCKMFIASENRQPVIQRMDCNTNKDMLR